MFLGVQAIRVCEGIKACVLQDEQSEILLYVPRRHMGCQNAGRIDRVIGKLRDGKLFVVVRQSGNRIIIDPMTTCSAEEEVVAERLKKVLT